MNNTNSYRYRVVDVFTRQPLEGNALAVFPDAAGLDGARMQKIARELNLSETVFISQATRADCAAGVRIFTPMSEMIFAGHPTIGASFVLLDEGIVSKDAERFALEEKIGPVPIRVERGERPLIWLTTPPIHAGKIFDPKLCAQALGLGADDLLGIAPQILSAGNPTLYIPLKDQAAVDRAWFDMQGVRTLDLAGDSVCVFVFTPTEAGAYSRMFAPEHGVVEDPATGSSTGPLAAYMLQHGLVAPSADGTRFISEQGTKMGRRSFLHVQLNGEGGANGIEVGGYVTPLVDATMRF